MKLSLTDVVEGRGFERIWLDGIGCRGSGVIETTGPTTGFEVGPPAYRPGSLDSVLTLATCKSPNSSASSIGMTFSQK